MKLKCITYVEINKPESTIIVHSITNNMATITIEDKSLNFVANEIVSLSDMEYYIKEYKEIH